MRDAPILIHCTRDTFDGKIWRHEEFGYMASKTTIFDAEFVAWADRREEEFRMKHARLLQ